MSELLDFKAKVDFTQAKRDLADFEKMLAGMKISPAAGNTGWTSANAAMNKAIRDSLLETERLRQENIRLQNQWQQGAITINELTARQKANTLTRQQATAEARAARQVQEQVNGSYFAAQARLKALGQEIKSYENGLKRVTPELRAKVKEYDRLNDSLKKFDASMGNHQRKVAEYERALNGIGGTLAGLITTYLGAQTVIATFNQSLRSDAVRASLEFTFGSVDLADAKLEQLLETANRLGINYDGLVSSYKSFTGAVVASNFDFQQGERIFNAVAVAASRLKLSSEDTEGSLKALQQMISKGNVQAEELRGQLGERIPGAFSIAARAMGVTETQLNKLLESGDVLAADLLPKLAVELEKTFGSDTTEQVNGLSAAWERLKNVFTGTVGESTRISRFFETIVDGAGRAAKAIVNIVNSDSWDELNARLFVNDDGKTGDAIRDIRKTYEKGTSLLNRADDINVETASVKQLTNTYEELKIQYDQAAKALDTYKKGLADGTLVEKGNVTFQRLSTTVDRLSTKMNQVKQFLPAAAGPVKPAKSSAQIAEEKRLAREAETQLNAQISMQKRVDALLNEAKRKQLSRDQEEVQAVRDKFDALIKEVERFNSNPKNKAKVGRIGALTNERDSQIQSIEYRQETKRTEEFLNQQKSLYAAYEQYKTDFGKEAADNRYKNELDTSISYLEDLQMRREALLAKGESNFTEGEAARFKLLSEMVEAASEQEADKQEELLKQFMGYSEKRKRLIEKYNDDYALLASNHAAQEELTKQHNAELRELDIANMQKLESYQTLFDGIESLSKASALKLVADTRQAFEKSVKSGKIVDPVEIDRIRKYLDDIGKKIKTGTGRELIEVANTIDDIVSSLGGVDSAFGKILSTVSNVVGQVGNIKNGMAALKAPGASGLEKLTAGLGIVGAGVSIFSSVFKLFDRSAKREEQAAYARDLQNKQTEALNKALQRQVELLDEVYGTERILKYGEALKQARDNEAKYTQALQGKFAHTGDKTLDKYITKLNNGEALGPVFNEKDLRKQLTEKGYSLSADLRDLQQLLDEGKLDAGTATIVTNLIEANKTAQELANNLKAENVGASLDTIADEFINSLTDGVDGVGDVLEKSLRRGLLNALKGDIINQFINGPGGYYDLLDKALSDGLVTAEEDRILRDKLKEAEDYGKKRLEYINGVAPETGPDAPSSSLSKNITQISSDQANALEGITRGQYDLQKQHLVIDTKALALLTEQGKFWVTALDIGRSKLAHLAKIEANTANTVVELQSAVVELKAINSNTKSGSLRGSGLGI